MPKLNDPLQSIDAATAERINAERVIDLARYQEDGAESRIDYFLSFHFQYGIDVADVITIADLLGPEEDFDGLVTSIEDGAEGYGFAANLFGGEA